MRDRVAAARERRAPQPPEPRRAEPVVGASALRTAWRAAFADADEALRAGARYLPPEELRARGRRLREERETTAQLLRAFARDQRASAQFLHRFLPPDEARRLLGLPADVGAFVFRLDGVLVGSAAVHAAAWAETFDEFVANREERARGRFELRPFDVRVDYPEHIHGKPRLEGVRGFLASRGIRLPEGSPDDAPGAETVHGLANRKNLALLRRIAENRMPVSEGSRRYLTIAHDAGVRSAVVSASAHTHMVLERAGLADFVDGVVDADVIRGEGLLAEPEPDWLLAACRLLATEPERAAVFETTPAGVEAGRAAGFRVVVGVDRAGRPEALRAAGADVVVAGLADLLDREIGARL